MKIEESEVDDDLIIQKAKEYNHTQEYQFDLYVDAKDSIGKWGAVQIVEMDESKNVVRVHYDGWSEKYDDYISLTSNKIAPFRFYTNCYTGQTISAYRDFHFNYVLNEKFKKELKNILKNGFEVLETPRKVTQYIRGELYFYVDSMLSLHLNTTTDELPLIYDFMKYVYKVIQLWFKIFPLKLSKGYENSLKNKKLYLVDFDTALSKGGFELIDILAKSFGLCSRCLTLYKHFGNAYYFQGSIESVPYFPERGFGFMYSLMNLFSHLNGLESIKRFVLGLDNKNDNSIIPIFYIDKLLQSLKYFYQRCNSALATEILEMVKQCCKVRGENMTIKDLNTNQALDLVETLKLYLARRNSYKVAEELELLIAK